MEEQPLLPRNERRELTNWELIKLNFLWFPMFFHTTILMTVLIPFQVLYLSTNQQKGVDFGLVMTIVSASMIIAGPIAGYLSDKTNTRFGKRRPWIIVGLFVNCLNGFAMCFAPSYTLFCICIAVDVLCALFIYTPFIALIPDLVPESQTGKASGWYQAFLSGGSLCACVLGLFADKLPDMKGGFMFYTYVIEIGLVFLGIPVMIFLVKEYPSREKESNQSPTFGQIKDAIKRFVFDRNFIILCLLNCLSQGFTSKVTGYYQYYVVDVLKPPVSVFDLFTLPDAPSVSSAYQISTLIGATISCYPSGIYSDKYGRRVVLFLSFLFQLASPLGLALSLVQSLPSTPFELDFLYGFLYGIGNGAFNAVIYAAVCDVLEEKKEDEKILAAGETKKKIGINNGLVSGIFTMSQAVGGLISPSLNGFLIDKYKVPYGYFYLYISGAAYLLVGGILVWFMRKRKVKENSISIN